MNAGINFVRFLLAFNVVLFHVWNSVAPGAGPVAVVAFFYISGYLITQVVQTVYAGADQTGAFLANRFLRIYPQYLGAVALGLALIYLFPDTAYDIHSNLSWPADAAEWIPQFSIFGLYHADVRALPAAWSLSTELYFYLLIGLVTGRSKKLAVALFALSLPVGVLCALKVLPFDFYGHPLGNAFAFAFGSVTYFYRDALSFKRWQAGVAAAAYALHTYAVPFLLDDGLDDANLAASLLPFSTMLVYSVRNDSKSERAAAWASVLGRLAYPLFLVHWAAAILVSHYFFGDRAVNEETSPSLAGALYFLTVFVVALTLSALSFVLIDRPVERIRRVVRGIGRRRLSPA
jgi:peptidoglycan/LPS O-acetylase OafA/YrhL